MFLICSHAGKSIKSISSFIMKCLLYYYGQVSSETVVTMRHEFEGVERKIKDLTKSFHSNFKMEGEPSCSGAIFLLNDHLKKRALCRLIREDLQVSLFLQ